MTGGSPEIRTRLDVNRRGQRTKGVCGGNSARTSWARHLVNLVKKELSQYSTQQEILQTLVDLEKELPLESLEVAEFVIRTLWERFYETKDAVVRVKVVSLLGSVAKFPGVNIHAIAEDLIKLLNADRESRNIGNIICLVLWYFRLSML